MTDELEHRQGTEADGWYCWCLPRVEFVGQGVVVVHNRQDEN